MNKSTNSGATWSQISQYYPDETFPVSQPPENSTHADVRILIQLPALGADCLFMGNDGGIAKTINSGVTWKNLNGNGLQLSQEYAFASFNSNENLVTGLQDNVTKLKNGANNQWTSFVLKGDGGWSEADYTNDNIVYASVWSAIWKSTNGGLTYTNINSAYNANDNNYLGNRFHIDPSNHNKLWFGIEDLRVYNEPTNTWTVKYQAPTTWIDVEGTERKVGDISAINVAPSNGNVIYLAYRHCTWGEERKYKFLKSIDGGTNWVDMSANIGAYDWTYITDFEIDPTNPNRVWASCAGYWYNSDPSQGVNRVIFSNDGGITWGDFSTGLPPLPVNCLAYQNGTNDVIYAGTDAGVYRWTQATNWQCFNNGLPNTIVTKIEINNCKGKLLISTFGRGTWETALPATPIYFITSSQTWNNLYDRAFNTDVVVVSGVILTIRGKVTFAAGKKLLINQNAKVILDNGKLTNSCNGLWGGVEVDGDNAYPQDIVGVLAPHQGILEIKNGGTIENAVNGITIGSTYIPTGDWIWNSFGGIILASNGRFKNNKRDVQFMSYPNYNNKSFFNNCTFETERRLNTGAIPTTRVSMWNVKNVSFRGSKFKYSAGNTYPIGSRGIGIFSIDAKFNVIESCSSISLPCPTNSIIKSTFENFDYGIVSENSNTLMNATIVNSQFINNNFGGASLSGMHYPIFNSNTVEVGSAYQSFGLYLQNCKYYKVEANSFNTLTNGYVGIYTRNCGVGVHEIYRNTFNNLVAGIIPQDNNSGTTNFTDGLKMNCNTFTNNDYDIAVMSQNSNASVAFIQGLTSLSPNTLVKNYYSAICGYENKFYIDGSAKSIIHSSYSGANYSPLPQPGCSDILVNVILS